MKVLWTEVAAQHLAAIYAYVAMSSPVYAAQLIRRLQDRTAQLEHFPESGRPTPEGERHSIREVFERPYRVLYRVKGGRIEIIAVVHMRQMGPSLG